MICAIVLAAGRSERMGTQKLLLPLGGKPVIAHVVDELLSSSVEHILVVTGRDGELIRAALQNRPVQFIENRASDSDMLGSARCGLRRLPAGCDAVLLALGDQPGIKQELVDDLIRSFREGKAEIVVPMCDGHRGHPVLFSTRFCDELLTGNIAGGLREFLDAHRGDIFFQPVAHAAALEDMDTPADYERQKRRWTEAVTPGQVRRYAR